MAKAARRLFVATALVCSGGVCFGQGTIENWVAPALWSAPAKSIAKGDVSSLAVEAVEAVPTPPLHFVGLTPCRLVDTRGNGFTGQYGQPALSGGAPRNFVLAGQCGISPTAQAVSLNITVTNTQGPGFILIYPQGAAQPSVSTLNYVAGQTIANAAVVPLGVGGGITVVAGVSGTDLILDTNGDYRGGVVIAVNGVTGNVTLDSDFLTITTVGQNVFLDGSPGGVLPVGAQGQTLRHNGTTWVPSSLLTNDGFSLVTVDGTLRFTDAVSIATEDGEIFHNGGGDGSDNTFVGLNSGLGSALAQGTSNTGVGALALDHVNPGSVNNTALGKRALTNVTTGTGNIGIGMNAGAGISTGSNNIVIGVNVGLGIGAASNNLYIGSGPVATESGQIRIGTNGVHTQGTVIASIHGFGSSSGIPVIVNSGGRLGTTTSSVRFKEEVRDIGRESDGLMSLRPVAFRYKRDHDASGLRQYGLIAEEVAEIYPELVVYDDEGQPQAIRSQLLDPLLLNEVQKQRRSLEAQRFEIEELKTQLAKLAARLESNPRN